MKLLISFLFLFSWTMQGVEDNSSDAFKIELFPSLDPHIVFIKGKWMIILSDKTEFHIRKEDTARFEKWMRGFKDTPSYSIEKSVYSLFSHQLTDMVNPKEIFFLESPKDSREQLNLTFLHERFYTLDEVKGDTLAFIAKESENKSFWKFVNPNNQYAAHDWVKGSNAVIVEVVADEEQRKLLVGYLLFLFDPKKYAGESVKTSFHLLIIEVSKTKGYWVTPLLEKNQ